MKKSLISFAALLLCVSPAFAQLTDIKETAAGTIIGRTVDKKIGFHGKAGTAQRAAAAQAALVNSTTGSASGTFTLAAGVGDSTITIPLTSLATGLSTAAIDLLTNYTPGYKFKVLSFDFIATVPGTGSGASQTFNLEIGTTNVTGGSLNVTLSSTDTIGKITAGSAITAANTGTSTDTLSIEMAGSGTVFTAGAGYFVIKIQNMDTADAHATEVVLLNELRASLVAKGFIKGAP